MQQLTLIARQVIVITGASSGVGRVMATELAAYGARLVLTARRESALEEVARECRELGADVRVEVADTRVAAQVEAVASAAIGEYGRIDVWINNAGVLAAGELDQIPQEVNENVIRTNLIGYINGAHAALPHFKRQGRGILINNISMGGWFPSPHAAAYTASKFGIRGFSEALKGELRKYREIHVVDLYPGFLDTPGVHHAANYTGKVIKPAPPVYDPRKVAREIIELIRHPRPVRAIGASSVFLRLAYALLPATTRSVTDIFIRAYLRQADNMENTPGNVVEPVAYGTSADGGWRRHYTPGAKGITLSVAALSAGLLLMRHLASKK